MSRKLKVVWTENAVQDLLVIKSFISQDSSERADAWINELYNAGESVGFLPNRGRIVPEFNQKDIRELLIENYRLVYRVKSTVIEIITVFEGHRRIRKEDINE